MTPIKLPYLLIESSRRQRNKREGGSDTQKSNNKLIAAYDMYFCKFPKHDRSYLRVCTINSRYRDCDALMSLGYIKNLLNIKDEADILDWVYTNQIADEIFNMVQAKGEYNETDSYFPYQADMGLFNKTYYSNTKNPQTHLFINSIGFLSKYARSRNARHISDINTLNLVQNAKIVAYAFGTRFEFSKPIEVEGNPKIPDGEKEDLIDVEPESTDGHEWFTYFQNRNFKLSKEIIAFVEREKKRMSSMTL